MAGDERSRGEALAEPAIDTGAARGAAPFGPALALTVVLSLAAWAVVMSIVMLVVDPQPITGLGTSQRQDAESALFIAAFGVIVPLTVTFVPGIADRIAAGPNASALSALTALMWAALAAIAVAVRLSDHLPWGDGLGVLLTAVLLWWAAAGICLARAAAPRAWPALLAIGGRAPACWAAAAVLALASLLTVTDLHSVSLLAVALGAVAILLVLRIGEGRHWPRLPQPWGRVADVTLIVLVLLAVPDLVVFSPEDPTLDFRTRFANGVIQFHHNFLLGPANQVLGGDTMLVDTASQYGVASIYLIAGWFKIFSISYGTFGLLDGVLTALAFASGYCILRMGGCSRLIAGSALALAVVALVFNRLYPVGALPQEGPLRSGLPVPLILFTVAAARWPAARQWARAAALAILGLSSIWALEGFGLTVGTFVALALFQAYLLAAGTRLRWLTRQALLAVAACACAHLLLAIGTLIAAGQLPEWGQYLAFLHRFLFGSLGKLTYDVSRWSPALAVGAAYVGSASAIVLLARRHPLFVRREQVTMLALTGTTAYGILTFYYFVDRSADHVLPYVCLPVLLTVALWLSLLLRMAPDLPRGLARGALAFVLAASLLVLAVAWSSISGRIDESALAYAVPGGKQPGDAIDRLEDFPPLTSRVLTGKRLLETYMPGERRSVVLVKPDLDIEILMHSKRSNELPIANAIEDGFVDEKRAPGVDDAVDELKAGRRFLADEGTLAGLAKAKRDPKSQLLEVVQPGAATAPLQVRALLRMNERFRFKPVYRSPDGLVVVELRPRP